MVVQGCGDIRISSLLVDLKQRHPDRVVLLLGNRDVNKMRFASELHHSDLARPIAELPGVHSSGVVVPSQMGPLLYFGCRTMNKGALYCENQQQNIPES